VLVTGVRRFLARWLPFLRQHTNIVLGEAAMSADSLMTASGRVWSPHASVDERIELLRQHFEDLERRVGQAETTIEDVRSSSAAGDQALWAETAALRQLHREQEQHSAALDARGLPVAALGITFGAIPQEVADLPYHLGLVANFVAIAITTIVGVQTWRERHPA
jgi:hypothetical protein